MNKKGHEYWRLLFLLSFLLTVHYISAQQTDEKVYDKVEKMPEFPGGYNELMKFLRIPLPSDIVLECGIQGRVIIQFIVEKDGTVTHPKVVRSVDPYLDRDALKLLGRMPRWIPGEQGGHKVRVKMAVPVRGESKDFIKQDKEKDKVFIQKQKPLIFIDTLEVSQNIFNALDLDNVESYTIIRGQEALDRYGERGKNGVALITLKSEEEMEADSKTVAEQVAIMLKREDFNKRRKRVYWLDDKQLSPDDTSVIIQSKSAKYSIEIKKEEIINVLLKTSSCTRSDFE